MAKSGKNRLLTYFFRGLLIAVPLAITIYVLIMTIQWIDGLFKLPWPGVGLVVLLVGVTILGALASFFLTKPIFTYFERALEKIPFVSLLYTSMKDLVSAFVGEKKKFDKPVMVQLDESGSIYKMGFITRQGLDEFGMGDLVSVYLPHSYNFSGNHFLVPKERIRDLDLNGPDAMKFIVSGGVSGL